MRDGADYDRPMARFVLVGGLVLALLVAGCTTGTGDGIDPAVEAVESVPQDIADDYARSTNTIVRSNICHSTTDLQHFRCTIEYETANGAEKRVNVVVTCDDDRCAWRED